MKSIEIRKHHYVPQFLLRNFATEERESLFAFDKLQECQFAVAVNDAAAEKGYNTFETSDGIGCAEEILTAIETRVSDIIHSMVKNRQLPKVSQTDKKALAELAVSQILRSKNYRAIFEQTGEVLRKLAELQGTPEFKKWVGDPNPAKEKRTLLEDFDKKIADFLPYMLDKDLALFSAPEEAPLLIGDSPVIRTNTMNTSELVGTQGLACVGVEIYLPLSPTLVLGFMCPSINGVTRELIYRLGNQADTFSISYQSALHFGRPVPLQRPNVDFMNSHQVLSAERFVYSQSGDFQLVKKMIEDDPARKAGARVTISPPFDYL